MADDTITLSGKPSCACHCGEYVEVTRTYKNYCPRCKKSGTLSDSPKKTAGSEGEVTCDTSKGGCGADYCINCGGDKSNNKSCSREDWRLVSADSSSGSDGEASEVSYDEMIKDLLKPLDGEVEYKLRGNKVYINKVPNPEEECVLWVREGVNITNDGVSISDYNPDTPNFFIVSYGENFDKKFVVKIPSLIERFGYKIKEVNAVKKVLKWVLEDSSSETSEDI